MSIRVGINGFGRIGRLVLRAAWGFDPIDQETVSVCCYPRNTGFVEAVATRLQNAMAEMTAVTPYRVLFSAHGLPQKVVDKGDPYQWAVEQTAAAVIEKLDVADLDWRISYQSRVGPLEWIKPYTEDEITHAGKEGMSLIVVPIDRKQPRPARTRPYDASPRFHGLARP